MRKKRIISVTLDKSIALNARIFAAKLDISRSALINYLIEHFLEDESLQAKIIAKRLDKFSLEVE